MLIFVSVALLMVIELFSAVVNTARLFCEVLAVNHFILYLDVCQLIFQLGWVGSFDNSVGWCEIHFKKEVIEPGFGIKNTVVSQYLVVEIDAIFGAVNLVQLFFIVNSRGFFVSRA